MRGSALPSWLVISLATAVALCLVGGTVALLLVGRPVPDRLWDLDMMVGGAYFVGGPFSVVFGHQVATQAAQIDTVNHSIAALREAVGGRTTTSGTGSGPP